MKVCKFGGSSVKNSIQIKKVIEILKDDKNRKVIVVSAPGRDEKYNEKITDHLLNISKDGTHLEISSKESYNAIINKYTKLCEDLQIDKSKIIEPLKEQLTNCSLDKEKKKPFFFLGESIIMQNLSIYI